MTKKSKIEKYYKEFDKIAEDILFKNGIGYDLIELVPYEKGFFGIKIYIENSGTYLDSCNKNDYILFLKDIKKEILKNPYKCPFCEEKNPEDICKGCGAILLRSNGLSGNENNLTNYNRFEDFAKQIEINTGISKEIIETYCNFNGDIKDIIDGVEIIYKGTEKYPVFCLNNKIKIKDLAIVDKKVYEKLILSYIALNSKKHNLIEKQMDFDFNNLETMIQFNNSKYNVKGIMLFENEFFGIGSITQKIKLGVEFEPLEYIEKYLKENNLDLEMLEYYHEKFVDDIMDFDCYDEMIGFDNYIVYMPKDGFEFNQKKAKESFDIKKLEKYFDSCLDKWIEKVLKSIEENLLKILKECK